MSDQSKIYVDLTTAAYETATKFLQSEAAKNALENPASAGQCQSDFAQGFRFEASERSEIVVPGNFEIRQTARGAVTCIAQENPVAQQAFESALTDALVAVLIKNNVKETEQVLRNRIMGFASARLAPCWQNAATGGGKKPIGGSDSRGFAQIVSVTLKGTKIFIGCPEEKLDQLTKECLKSLQGNSFNSEACDRMNACAAKGGDFLVASNAETDTSCPALSEIATDTLEYLVAENLLPQSTSDTANFLSENGIWIAVGILVLIFFIAIVFLLIRRNRTRRTSEAGANYNNYTGFAGTSIY
jgi:hypothetical protein